MSTAALFERLAPRYDELWTETAVGRAQRNAVWRVVDKLYGVGDCVLDIGCGTGEDAAHLGSRGVLVYGIDASPAMVERARARGVRAEVRQIEDLARASSARLDKLKRNLQYYPTCTEMGHSCTEMGHSGRSAVSPHFVSPSKRCNGFCAAVDFCGSRLILQVPLKHVPQRCRAFRRGACFSLPMVI